MNEFVSEITIKEIIIRVSMAIVVGGIIGYERGHRNRPAGFRTHILVCLGATLISILEDVIRLDVVTFMVQHSSIVTQQKLDIGRYGAQVISGIGFLGAGTIMRDKGRIGGLTTAASIWATGCIGLVIGWGFYPVAIIAVTAVIVTLVILKQVEVRFIDNRIISKIKVTYAIPISDSHAMVETYKIFEEYSLKIKESKKDATNNSISYTLVVPRQEKIFPITTKLLQLREVSSVDVKETI